MARSSTTFDIQINYNGNTPYTATVNVTLLGNSSIGIADTDASFYIMDEDLGNLLNIAGLNQGAVDAWMASQVINGGFQVIASFVSGTTVAFNIVAPPGTGNDYNGHTLAAVVSNGTAPDVVVSNGRDATQGVLYKTSGGVTIGNIFGDDFEWKMDWDGDGFPLTVADLPAFAVAVQGSGDLPLGVDFAADAIADDGTPVYATYTVTLEGPEGENWNGRYLEVGTGNETGIISLSPSNPVFSGFPAGAQVIII